LSQNQKLTVDR